MRITGLKGVFPLKAVMDQTDDPAQNATVIDPGRTTCQRKKRPDPLHLALRQKIRLISSGQPVNHNTPQENHNLLYHRAQLLTCVK